MSQDLEMYVIYCHPLDMPTHFVCRRWRVVPGSEEPIPDKHMFANHLDLNQLRSLLPPGLVCLTRSEGDDPAILETWL
jgi:hypothetical protein